jgi:thymidine kinase
MTGQELKSLFLNEKKRFLCHNCKDRYCQTYDCNIVDKAQLLTYKQWDNVAKIVSEDYLIAVPYEIWKRRVKR